MTTRERSSGRSFTVSHFHSEDDDVNKTSTIPETDTESKDPPSTTSTPQKYGSNTSTRLQDKTPPPSTFKQVKWLDSPVLRTPISRSQTPFGHQEDPYIDTTTPTPSTTTDNANNITLNPDTTTTIPRHVVTRHWQHHILLDDSLIKKWPSPPSSSHKHGSHDRSKAHSFPEDETSSSSSRLMERHITAEELEQELEKYEHEMRARRRARTQSTYQLPVTDREPGDEGGSSGGNGNSSSNNNWPPPFRRWSDVYRLASRFDKSAD